MFSGSGADIDDTVCSTHGIFIMLHHDQTVAKITETHQCPQKLVIISLVKPDTRLIQDICNPHKPGSDLCGKTDSLCFPTRKCSCRTSQCQIIQSYIYQEAKPGTDFL